MNNITLYLPVTFKESPGVAETATAEATRAIKVERRELENIFPVSR